MTNSVKNGIAEEAYAISRCISHGYDVAIPYGRAMPYDFIVDSNKKLYRVEVKKIYYDPKGNNWIVRPTRSPNIGGGKSVSSGRTRGSEERRYTRDIIDILMASNQERNWLYIFPVDFVETKTSISVSGGKYDEYRDAWVYFEL